MNSGHLLLFSKLFGADVNNLSDNDIISCKLNPISEAINPIHSEMLGYVHEELCPTRETKQLDLILPQIQEIEGMLLLPAVNYLVELRKVEEKEFGIARSLR